MTAASTPVVLRPVRASDLDWILETNNRAVPAVNELDAAALQRFFHQTPYFKVAEAGSRLAAFFIALTPEIDYASPNFLWFRARYRRFFYLDRIVVTPAVRGLGIGRRLYADLESAAGPTARRLACEVNLKPPNEGSLRFHRRFGFVEVGRQETENGAKTVALMIKELSDQTTRHG